MSQRTVLTQRNWNNRNRPYRTATAQRMQQQDKPAVGRRRRWRTNHSTANNTTTARADVPKPGTPRDNIPDGKKRDVETTTATKHGRPGPYGPPHNPDGPTTGEQTPASQHHPPGTHRLRDIHRTGQAGRRNPSEPTGKTTKTTSDYIDAGYTTDYRPNCCTTTTRR